MPKHEEPSSVQKIFCVRAYLDIQWGLQRWHTLLHAIDWQMN